MSWRDVLTAEPAPQYSQYPHNYQGLVPEPISEDCEDIGEQNRAVNSLHGQARQAADWEALYTVLDAAQAAYDDGDVTREEVGALAGYVADRYPHTLKTATCPSCWHGNPLSGSDPGCWAKSSCGWQTLLSYPTTPARSSTGKLNCATSWAGQDRGARYPRGEAHSRRGTVGELMLKMRL